MGRDEALMNTDAVSDSEVRAKQLIWWDTNDELNSDLSESSETDPVRTDFIPRCHYC